MCDGRPATIVGTDGDDVLVGTSERDTIVGLGGNDTIKRLAGADVGCGGPGDDVITGGGDMRAFGEAGNDTVSVSGGSQANYPQLDGADGDDLLVNDSDSYVVLEGGTGHDTLLGGTGSNLYRPGPGDDTVDGRYPDPVESFAFDDYIDYSDAGPVVVNLMAGYASGEGNDRILDVTAILGSSYADILIGTDDADLLDGGDNERLGRIERVSGRGGDDFLRTGTRILGGLGNDTIAGSFAVDGDEISGGAGTDVLDLQGAVFSGGDTVDLTAGTAESGFGTYGVSGIENVLGGEGDDVFIGDDVANLLKGNGGRDAIDGGGGDDDLRGNADGDTLVGGPGSDDLDGGRGRDACTDDDPGTIFVDCELP